MSDRVVKFVNHIRESEGLPPVTKLDAGVRNVSRECPIARTIGGDAHVHNEYTVVFGKRYDHPWLVKRWIAHFDRGKYDELVTSERIRRDIAHLDFEPEPEKQLVG